MTLSQFLSDSKLYLDKPYIKVGFNTCECVLFNVWSGFSTYEEILEVGRRTIEAATKEGAYKVLFDSRKMEVLDMDSLAYISGEFTYQMNKIGIKYAATVLPVDLFAKISIDQIQGKLQDAQVAHGQYFKSFDDALAWLRSKA